MSKAKRTILRPRPVRWDRSSQTRQVHALYTKAFPVSEQAPLPLLHVNALRRSCNFFAWCEEEDPTQVRGLSYSFAAPDLVYLGYLAVDEELRGQGFGSQILNAFQRVYPERTQILEIEPVDESSSNYEQRRRRLAFYEKNGFRPTSLMTHEAKESYSVLTRNGSITKTRLQEALNEFGLWIVRTRVTDES
ncbi:GNAT family N-acetyltransferase [Schaalia sp. ZJ405]|uniref:GNAT family N-acetyltransferase n=1 Tax=unclassified Schaalia TaxID=2691889 RepID=UPI0013EBD1D5|nr:MULTISPECIES: GNAT family N-acetyltransferase [unclassified Schaalia]QPK81645.1 GNAT family N-acetyltransferase [Schaalia sp. ZJ405]